MKLLFSVVIALSVRLTEACFGSSDKTASATTNFPIPATQKPTGVCGHSIYWNSGEASLTGSSIVGGVNAKQNEFPYQALLSVHCGASIISNTFVLTAGHCCYSVAINNGLSRLRVIVGEHDTSKVDTGEVSVGVSEMIFHPGWNSDTMENDYCLLRLADTLTWTQQVQPVCLPRSCSEECQVGEKILITGWGAMTEEEGQLGVMSTILQKASVPVVSLTTCSPALTTAGLTLNDNNTCAGYSFGGIDTCQGDSGGPMVCYKNGYYQLDGVTSMGYRCASPNYYGVYARVCKVLDWINTALTSTTSTSSTSTTTNTPAASTSTPTST